MLILTTRQDKTKTSCVIFFRYLSPHLYDFLEALITQQTSPEEAYRKFDAIAAKLTEQLRKCTKQVRIRSIKDLSMREGIMIACISPRGKQLCL